MSETPVDDCTLIVSPPLSGASVDDLFPRRLGEWERWFHDCRRMLPPEVWSGALLGWSMLPCGLNKRPLLKTWKRFQAAPPAIRKLLFWATALRPRSWAVVTGAVSRVWVLDFDGVRGQQTLRRLGLDSHLITGSGGSHVYVEYPTDLIKIPTLNHANAHQLDARYPGMDIRGTGGCSASRLLVRRRQLFFPTVLLSEVNSFPPNDTYPQRSRRQLLSRR
jgi:hypothetical protein